MREIQYNLRVNHRSNHPKVFLGKGFLKICSKITGEHTCRSVIPIKLLCNFVIITLRHGCSPVNLLHVFRTPFFKNTSGWLLLNSGFFTTVSKNSLSLKRKHFTSQKMKFSIKEFFSKCDQIRRKIWSHLLKKSLMENLIFCAVFHT